MLLGTSLSLAVVLSTAERAATVADTTAAWMGAWLIAAVLALLAVLRRIAPIVPGPAPGFLWWFAGISGAGVLGRHTLDSLSFAAAEVPTSAPLAGPFDLGDLLLWALMLLGVLATTGLSSRRPPGMAMGLGLALMLAPVALLLVLSLGHPSRHSQLVAPLFDGPPWLLAAGLVWVVALVTCEKARARGEQGFSTWLPALLTCALFVAVPYWLLRMQGGAGIERADGALLQRSGVIAFGYYGARVSAGIEALATLAGIVALLGFTSRCSAITRLLGRGEHIAAVSASAALAALVPLPKVLWLAALAGWLAVIMGLPIRESEEPEEIS